MEGYLFGLVEWGEQELVLYSQQELTLGILDLATIQEIIDRIRSGIGEIADTWTPKPRNALTTDPNSLVRFVPQGIFRD